MSYLLSSSSSFTDDSHPYFCRVSEKEQDAFNHHKSALCCAPVYAFRNFDQEVTPCTGASDYGIGAILMQYDDNGKNPVKAYASRLFNKAEENYDVTSRESLSFIWALHHFRELILGYKIHVLTPLRCRRNFQW